MFFLWSSSQSSKCEKVNHEQENISRGRFLVFPQLGVPKNLISVPKLVVFDTNSLHRGGTIFNFQFSIFNFQIFNFPPLLVADANGWQGRRDGTWQDWHFYVSFQTAILLLRDARKLLPPTFGPTTMHIALAGCCAVTSRVQNCTQSLFHISHCC